MNETISVIIPVCNERDNLDPLLARLAHTLDSIGGNYEIVFVDDGSTDGSGAYLQARAQENPRIKLIEFRRNFGQTAAMAAGFDFAQGQIIIALDADLQNDPADIPSILTKLHEGFDVVSCWRRDRKDPWLDRKLPSQLANLLISHISGVRLHDYGCTLKGYRREVLQHVRLYGEMHRFIPIYASWAGARVAEIPVAHYARAAGKSKYGLSRTIKVIFDLVTIKFMARYMTKPIYVFGSAGLLSFAFSLFSAVLALLMKVVSWPHHAD